MALIDQIIDTFPANGDSGVPLLSTITITLSGTDYQEQSLLDGFFIEGSQADQIVGAGLIELSTAPITETDLNSFLGTVPPYTGFVEGTTTVSTSGGNTIISFVPNKVLSAATEYTVNLASVYEADGTTLLEGQSYFSFTTGSGSIQEIPDSISTSVINKNSVSVEDSELRIIRTIPPINEVSVSPELEEIVIVFNKEIDPNSVNSAMFEIAGAPIIDHPKLNVSYLTLLAKIVSVSGNRVTLRI